MDRCAIFFCDTIDESVSYVNMSGLVDKLKKHISPMKNYTCYAFESVHVSWSILYACL